MTPSPWKMLRRATILPNFAELSICMIMNAMNIFLPDTLKAFVDEQVAGRAYGSRKNLHAN